MTKEKWVSNFWSSGHIIWRSKAIHNPPHQYHSLRHSRESRNL